MPTKEQLEQARDEGLKQAEAGERLGCCAATIRRHSRLCGVEWPPRPSFKPRHYALIDGEWLSLRQVADRYGIRHKTVLWRWRNGRRGEALTAPPRWDTRPPEHYETEYTEQEWPHIVEVAAERGIKYAAYLYGVPYGAVTAALRGEEYRLG